MMFLPGLLHPDHVGYFATPAEYLRWHRWLSHILRTSNAGKSMF